MTVAPAVSVVIATYNAERTLGHQLDALLSEDLDGELEILVCDNGSRDGSAAVAQAREGQRHAVRVVDASERPGPSAARNIGAQAARGALILFCDADDVIEPGWIAAMQHALESADLVAGTLEGRLLNADNRASVSWEVSADITMPYWPRFGAGASSNLGVRAEVFEAVGGFDEALRTGEDIDLCWRAQLAGFGFARSARAVVHSRQRDGRCAVWRQAFAYGTGSRALKRKYARHIQADRSRPAPTPAPAAPVDAEPEAAARVDSTLSGAPSRASRSIFARAARLLTPTGQANLAWRMGETLGARFGRVDARVVPLEPEL